MFLHFTWFPACNCWSPDTVYPSSDTPTQTGQEILDLEYVDMAELVPDTWRYSEDEGTKCCHQPRRTSRRAPVSDILLWWECYTKMATLLATHYPSKAAELLIYQHTILCAQ